MTQRHERHEFRRNRVRQMTNRKAMTKTKTKPNEKIMQEHMRAQATKPQMEKKKSEF